MQSWFYHLIKVMLQTFTCSTSSFTMEPSFSFSSSGFLSLWWSWRKRRTDSAERPQQWGFWSFNSLEMNSEAIMGSRTQILKCKFYQKASNLTFRYVKNWKLIESCQKTIFNFFVIRKIKNWIEHCPKPIFIFLKLLRIWQNRYGRFCTRMVKRSNQLFLIYKLQLKIVNNQKLNGYY